MEKMGGAMVEGIDAGDAGICSVDGGNGVGVWSRAARHVVPSGSGRGKEILGMGYGAARRGWRSGSRWLWGGRAYD